MTNRYSTLLLILAAVAFTITGCDQSSQTAEPGTANRYIISAKTSTVGDAEDVDIQGSTQVVTAPDTVSYAVQGFTTNKDYNWTVNDGDVPVETRSSSSYVWEAREGEFVTVVFTQEDPMANVNTETPATNTLRVSSPDDDIDAEEITITTEVPPIGDQVGRIGSFDGPQGYSSLADLAGEAGVADTLGDGNTYTLLAPVNNALGALPAQPTQATDPDEPATSSVLGDILKYHAIPADVASSDISDGQTAKTLFGDQTVEFSTGDGVSVNGGQASVTKPDFPATNGAIHGIDGVLFPSTASVDFTDRAPGSLSEDGVVTVDGSFIPENGGFVVLHDSTELANRGAIPSIIGVSEYISPSSIANEVEVQLDEAVSDSTTVGAMPHEDTNDNQTYDFVTSAGTEDTPYTLEGDPVIDYALFDIDAQ
jgi:uncharacterized surface protein with fasciclin (FAS1) repeats